MYKSTEREGRVYKSTVREGCVCKSTEREGSVYKSTGEERCEYKSTVGERDKYKSSVGVRCECKDTVGERCMYKSAVGERCKCKSVGGERCVYKSTVWERCVYKTSVGRKYVYKSTVGERCVYKYNVGEGCKCKSTMGERCVYMSAVGERCKCKTTGEEREQQEILLEDERRTEPLIEQGEQPEKTSTKLHHGQQQITTYFKSAGGKGVKSDELEDMENPEGHETSDIVMDDEGRRKLILLGSDVVGLFPAMTDINTGRAVASQVRKSPLRLKGVKYKEVARYCSGNRHLCGDLSEVENVLPWRRNFGKGGQTPGMQNPEMKGKRSGMEKVWQFPEAEPTEDQKKILLCRMAEIAVRTVWQNFTYEFGGETFLQSEGGPIGARLTMACSRLVMQDWAEGYRGTLERSGVTTYSQDGYVDDVRQNTDLMRKGSRFNPVKNRFTWRADWERKDRQEDFPDEVRMGNICLTAMNSICQDLTFTVESVHDFQNRKLATLDFQCEVIENQISYTYFQKSMKTPLVLGAASAMSEHQKISILSNELIRRMSNMSKDISQGERTTVADIFTKELKASGYTRHKAREIVVCGLLGLERKRKRREREGERFHRRAKTTIQKRTSKKLHGKQSWFKNKPKDIAEELEKRKENRERLREEEETIPEGGKTKTEERKNKKDPKAVIFVPYTHNSILAKELRKVEETMEMLTGTRIKIVEKAGMQLKQLLVKSNPWAGRDCEREECLVCQTREESGEGKGKTCWKRNLIYETWCGSCQAKDENAAREAGDEPKEVKLYKYVGESSRSAYLRGKNHLDDARLLSTGSHILKHYIQKHSEENPEDMRFKMRILSFKRSAYERQVHESVLIQQNRNHHLLNSKMEYNR